MAACLIIAGLLAAGLAGAWPGIGTWISGGPGGAGLAAGPAGSMPPYYVVLGTNVVDSALATVRDSANGAVLDRVHVPAADIAGSLLNPTITAAGDGRTFVIAGYAPSVRTSGLGSQQPRFYRLRLSADGRSASLSQVRVIVPAGFTATGLALSPDGRRLAVAVQQFCEPASCITGIRVVTLATGTASTWFTRTYGLLSELSWAGNDRIAFEWQKEFRLLRLAGPGGNLLASATIGFPAATPSHFIPAALITPDGTAVITSTTRNVRERDGRDTVVAQIVERSASTGKLVRVLHTATERDVAPRSAQELYFDLRCRALAMAPRGFHVLIDCFGFGRLDGTRFTPLPGVPATRFPPVPAGAAPAYTWYASDW